jgi:hypothetical protein
LLIALFTLSGAQPALCQIYAGRSVAGVVVLSNHRHDPAHELVVAVESPAAQAPAARWIGLHFRDQHSAGMH